MSEIDLKRLIEDTIKSAISPNVDNKPGKSVRFHREPIEGSTLAEAECPNCGVHGLVEPLTIEKEKPVEKIVEKEIPPDSGRYIDTKDADFNTLAPYLSKHQGGKSLFECDNCEEPAFDWMMKQKGFDEWLKKHGYKLVKK